MLQVYIDIFIFYAPNGLSFRRPCWIPFPSILFPEKRPVFTRVIVVTKR